jgi:hypothetical protein
MATSSGPPTGGGGERRADVHATGEDSARPVWYWVAVAVLLAGAAWAVVASVLLFGKVGSFPRVPDPGQGVISLTRSGGYVIYYEGPGPRTETYPLVTSA